MVYGKEENDQERPNLWCFLLLLSLTRPKHRMKKWIGRMIITSTRGRSDCEQKGVMWTKKSHG